ncbi:helix-turn-helix transcriptional regulator [Sphingobacterium gobiense]|uniref:HTH araC/xylS-type domain-containing protein n=1 Tax=Sphingobacterium gobiense TaxID=1382456 RepID=A0A2S9JNF3_9SPHI|nr:helix-turn-helix transcriptional regulator [Sphingobacterium gobiense]PRD54705.1 hypothetical protein C5749_14830 [Sphingobacterium gobiense]
MQFSLQFRHPTTTTLTVAEDTTGQQKLFPYTSMIHYQNPLLDMRRLHYSRQSIQLDHYSTRHDKSYTLDITAKNNAYVLIALDEHWLTYRSKQKKENELTFYANECLLIYAEAGSYTVELGGVHNRFLVISLAPALLYPLRDEFEELITFMDGTNKQPLSAMNSCTMDPTFRYRLQRLIDMPFGRYKDFNRQLLWQLPPLLSAYKGLLKGKDRQTREKQLMDDVYRHIDKELKAPRKVSIEKLCEHFPVSRRKLERLFSAHQNRSPSNYIRSRKMVLMGDLLRTTDISILELALMYGYSDSQSFNRAFKKEMGISPARYRLL